MRFKAAVLNKVNEPLAIDTLEMAPLAATDVLVKVRASGLCHTDLEVIEGSLAYPLPIVLGHEGAGVVEAVGSAVTQVEVGDHVVCSWNLDRALRFGATHAIDGSDGGAVEQIKALTAGRGPRRDFPWLVEQYLEGRLELDALITGRIRLEQINEGFASLARGEGIRTVVML